MYQETISVDTHVYIHLFIFGFPHPFAQRLEKQVLEQIFFGWVELHEKKKAEQGQDYILTLLWNGSWVLDRGLQWPGPVLGGW